MGKKIKLGWREYGALPELGIDRIHMKVDTGAKTSAIHSLNIRKFMRNQTPWVAFQVVPHQDDNTEVACEMPIKDQRVVISSNGHHSERIVIETTLVVGQIEKTIELTLIDRSKMKYRMLLGRQALTGMVVKPDKSHLTTKQKTT